MNSSVSDCRWKVEWNVLFSSEPRFQSAGFTSLGPGCGIATLILLAECGVDRRALGRLSADGGEYISTCGVPSVAICQISRSCVWR
jgi:hypothetical protein